MPPFLVSFLSLFLGLALFLFGVSLMGGALERTALGQLQKTLRRFAGTPLRGLILGALVTAAVQSSSAVTVITAGLVGAEIIPLEQAVAVIMGANIGTTVTAHLLRLGGANAGIFRLFSPAALAPVSIALGIILYLTARKTRQRITGQVLLGLGLLFIGMLQMEQSVAPLRGSPAFLHLLRGAEDPLMGVLAGAGVTAVIQSSSASVGILQAAAAAGSVRWAAAVPILLGQNIGTCVTSLLAAFSGNRGAAQTAAVHLLINLLGTTLFLMAIYGTGWYLRAPFWQEPVTKGGIANFHTLFNLTTALLLLPFTSLIARTVSRMLPMRNRMVMNKL